MATLALQFKASGDASFEGHRVVVRYQRKRTIPELEREITVDDSTQNPVLADGRANLEIDQAKSITGPLKVELRAPDGAVLGSRELGVDDLGKHHEMSIDPAIGQMIQPNPDPAFGKPKTLLGKVIVNGGEGSASALPVVIRGKRRATGGGQGDTILLTATSDENGYFTGKYPVGPFSSAWGEVAGQTDKPIKISLEKDGELPRRVVLAADLAQDLLADDTRDGSCCPATPPRAPDPDYLAEAGETFSEDVTSGRCIQFTKPNRILEEFDYFTVIRTTEPQLQSDDRKGPFTMVPLPAVEKMLQPEFSNAGEMRMLSASAAASHNTRGNGNAEGGAQLPGISLDKLRKVIRGKTWLRPGNLASAARSSFRRGLLDRLRSLSDTGGRSALNGNHPIDWDDDPTLFQAATIAHGHILHFKQRWHADGYSLGDLLYSLPLAPCQQKRIAVVDWDRREQGIGTESRRYGEALQASLSHDRDISEVARGVLTEHNHGWSSASTQSFSAGLGLGVIGEGFGALLGVAGGSGSSQSVADTRSARHVASSSAQNLRDRTMQAASSVRNQRSTVVKAVHQGETVNAQTETVANHNHCHAITVEYLEVLRHFLVSQDLVDVQECLFIPLAMSEFDEDKALRWRKELERYVWEADLRRGFDALERIANDYRYSDLPVHEYAEETLRELDGELHIEFRLARPEDKEDGSFEKTAWNWAKKLIGWITPHEFWHNHIKSAAEKDKAFRENLGPLIAQEVVARLKVYALDAQNNRIGGALPLDATLVSDFSNHEPLYVSLRESTGTLQTLSRKDVYALEFDVSEKMDGEIKGLKDLLPKNSRVIFRWGSVGYRTRHLDGHLFRSGRIDNDLTGDDPVRVSCRPLSWMERRDPREEDHRNAQALLDHLNHKLEFFHKAIWWSMDKDRRYLLLDGFEAPNGNGRSVASVVENRVIGMAGNSLIMPVARGFHLDPTFRQDKEHPVDLLEHYAPDTPIPPMRVAVPTKGVFAEAVMGQCNSCETEDDTRFWRWSEEPCPGDGPPAIQPVSTESRKSDGPDLKPGAFPQQMINMQSAPSAPDPTGLGDLYKLLGQSDSFRNLSGLDQNQKNALAALKTAYEHAQAFGDQAAKMAQSKAAREDADQTMRRIRTAEQMGLISKDQAKKHMNDLLETLTNPHSDKKNDGSDGGNGQDGKSKQAWLTDVPEFRSAIRNAGATGRGKIEASRNGESLSIDSGGGVQPVLFEGTLSSVKGLYHLIKHLAYWYSENLDGSKHKTTVRIDDRTMAGVRIGVNALDDLIETGFNSVKAQRHAVTFRTDKSFAEVAGVLDGFAGISDPQVIGCYKTVGASGTLAQGDEFRWTVDPAHNYHDIEKVAVQISNAIGGALPPGFSVPPIPVHDGSGGWTSFGLGNLQDLVLHALINRRFDVRIIQAEKSADSCIAVAQTVEDHPYAGRRLWHLSKTDEDGVFRIETAETNRFHFLPDFMVEHFTDGEEARLTWVHWLTRFVDQAEGTIVDNSLHQGKTVIGTYEDLSQSSLAQGIYSDYSQLKDSFDRLKDFEWMKSEMDSGSPDTVTA